MWTYSPFMDCNFCLIGSYFVDGDTIALLSFLLVLLYSFTNIKSYTLQPLFVIFIYATLFWFVIRLLITIYFPQSTIRFPAPVDTDSTSINIALVYVILSTIMVAFGFIFSLVVKVNSKNRARTFTLPKHFNLRRILLLFLFVGFGYLILEIYFGSGRHWLPSFMTRLLNHKDLVWVGFLLWIFGHSYMKRRMSEYVFFIIFAFSIISTFIAGSRGGFLNAVLIYIIGVCLFNKGGYIKKRSIIIIGMFVLTGPLLFGLASIGSYELRHGGFGNIENKLSLIYKSKFDLENLEKMMQSLSLRISGLDTLAIILKADEDKRDPDMYINFGNEIKSIANTYVIGEPFPEALITSKAFQVVYQDVDEESARNTAFTQKWTGYGLMFVKFGWYGGLLATFIVAFLFATLYRIIAYGKNRYRHLIMVYLLMILFQEIISHGVEDLVSGIHSGFLIGGVVNIILINILYKVESSFVNSKTLKV